MLLLRSIFFTFLLPGSLTVLLPYLFLGAAPSTVRTPVRYLGIALMACGGLGLTWCIWQFFAEGRGTLAPVDPPKKLVVKGLYRRIRNPMYVFVVTVLVGEAIWFTAPTILIEAVAFFALANLFVSFYEEPALERQFGEDYRTYKRSAGRWLPRLK